MWRWLWWSLRWLKDEDAAVCAKRDAIVEMGINMGVQVTEAQRRQKGQVEKRLRKEAVVDAERALARCATGMP